MSELDRATRGVEQNALRIFNVRVNWLEAQSKRQNIDTSAKGRFLLQQYFWRFPTRRIRRQVELLAGATWTTTEDETTDMILRASPTPLPVPGNLNRGREESIRLITDEIATSLDRLPYFFIESLLEAPTAVAPTAETVSPQQTVRVDGFLDAVRKARNATRRLSARLVTWTRSQAQTAVMSAYGVTHFVWETVGDDRVRPLHASIEGNTYPVSTGHPTEGRPGDPYNCRCSMQPVFPTGF